MGHSTEKQKCTNKKRLFEYVLKNITIIKTDDEKTCKQKIYRFPVT